MYTLILHIARARFAALAGYFYVIVAGRLFLLLGLGLQDKE
jgi:hypothetical protein